MTNGLEEIAVGLTRAQRRAIHRLSRDWRFLALSDRPDRTHPVIERWNAPYRGFQYRLTPLGLKVKALLQEQSNG